MPMESQLMLIRSEGGSSWYGILIDDDDNKIDFLDKDITIIDDRWCRAVIVCIYMFCIQKTIPHPLWPP